MATAPIIWADSFMGYSTAQSVRWYSTDGGFTLTINNTGGRGGRGSCVPNGTATLLARKSLGASYTCHIFSAAVFGQLGTNDRIFVGGQAFNGTSSGAVGWAGTSAVTSSWLPTSGWTYVSIRVFRSATVGTVDVWFNGANVLSLTGVNTTSGSAGEMDFSGGFKMSDLMLQASNTASDTPIGDSAVTLILPTGPGSNSGFTPTGAASNWQAVDDAPPDDDTSYDSSAVVGTKDSYAMADLGASVSTVYGVVAKLTARKTDAGTRSVAPLLHIGGTDYVGTGQNPGTSYGGFSQVYNTNPATSAAWTVADVNGLEMGEEVSA